MTTITNNQVDTIYKKLDKIDKDVANLYTYLWEDIVWDDDGLRGLSSKLLEIKDMINTMKKSVKKREY